MTDCTSDENTQSVRPFPRTLYVSLWFPLSSETFVFYEVDALYKRNLPVSVITLYAKKLKNLAPHIQNTSIPIEHFGIASLGRILGALWRSFRREPKLCVSILKDIFFRRWRDLEMRGENAWACLAGFYLAERCKVLGIEHIHAAWGNGPATAAYVVNKLLDIPFSFTARAGDVRPPDGFLQEKLEACAFARADSSFNIPHMASFLPVSEHDKLHLVYNMATLPTRDEAKVAMQAPYKVLAIGRLIETKGFHYLIEAVSMLVQDGFDIRLSIAGSGPWMEKLKQYIAKNNVQDYVEMLGFVTHDKISQSLLASDILVMPSVVELGVDNSDGLPTVVIEAMCHKVPVIGTDVASMSDVVIDGETGYLIPERDTKALAFAMQKLMQDRANALHMANNAKALVDKLFDGKKNIDRMCELFCSYTK